MGNDALLLKNDFSNLHQVSGSSTSTGSFGSLYLNGGNRLGVDSTTKRFINAEGNSSGRGFMVKDWDDNKSGSFYQRGSDTTLEAHSGALYFRVANATKAYVDDDGQMHVSATSNAAKPGYTFTDDTNTGMYRTGADGLGLATGGTARLVIMDDGKIGINEADPDTFLHIKNTSGDVRQLKLESTVAASYVETQFTTDAREWRVGAAGSGVANSNIFYIYDATAAAHRLDIDASGNIIFGTANAKISGSSTSTGSFGRLEIPMNAGSLNLYGNAELRI
jgi:hypothetical protein